MALWLTRNAVLLICQLLVVGSSGVTALQSFATTSSFEDFGNFGGFRGFHQFHGWLSNAIDDNAGSQSQGFPAGYTHPAADDDTFIQTLPGHLEEPDLKLYQTTPKSNTAKSSVTIPEVREKSKKLSGNPTDKADHEVPVLFDGKTHNAYGRTEQKEQFKDNKYSFPEKQRTITNEKDANHTGSVYDGVYESLKLHQKLYKPSEYSNSEEQRSGATGNIYLGGGVYPPISHHQTESSKYVVTPKQTASTKAKQIFGRISPIVDETDKYKPVKRIQKLKTAMKFAHTPKLQANNARKIYQGNPVYQVGNSGGFQPILYSPQEQLKAAKYTTEKQRTGKKGNKNSNVIYVYPSAYQQTLAAIDPAYRGVIKLQPPLEHHKYLWYKSTISTQRI